LRKFPSVGEIKNDLKLYELQHDDLLSLDKMGNLNTHHIIEDSTLPLSGRDDEILVAQENQSENEVHPQAPILEHEVSPLI